MIDFFWKTAETWFAVRGRSEHDPCIYPSVRNPPDNWGYFLRSPGALCTENCNISRSGYHSKFHQVLRLPRKVTAQLLNASPATKKTMCNLNATSSNIVPATNSDSWTVPNPAPATNYQCATWMQLHPRLHVPWKVTVELHQVLHLPRKLGVQLERNFTKYCACHEKCTYYSLTLVFFYSTTILWQFFTLNYSFSLLFFYSTILLRYDSFALVFFCSTYYSLTLFVSYSSSLLLYYVFTLLFFDSTILLLYYYFILRCRSYIGSFSTKFPLIIFLFTHHIYTTSLYLYFFETTKSSTLSLPFSTWHCRCNTDMFSCFPNHGIEYKGKQRIRKTFTVSLCGLSRSWP